MDCIYPAIQLYHHSLRVFNVQRALLVYNSRLYFLGPPINGCLLQGFRKRSSQNSLQLSHTFQHVFTKGSMRAFFWNHSLLVNIYGDISQFQNSHASVSE